MPQRAEIWYFEHSLAGPLARPLSRHYAVRALPTPPPGRRTTPPEPGDIPVVCFADLGAGDLAADDEGSTGAAPSFCKRSRVSDKLLWAARASR